MHVPLAALINKGLTWVESNPPPLDKSGYLTKLYRQMQYFVHLSYTTK